MVITLIFKNSLKNNVGDEPNYFMGLRTRNSMKNKKTWKLTQQFFIPISIKLSCCFLPLGIIWTVFDIMFTMSIISIIVQFILFIILIILVTAITEKEVKKFVS